MEPYFEGRLEEARRHEGKSEAAAALVEPEQAL
jgi:hypothetical protein